MLKMQVEPDEHLPEAKTKGGLRPDRGGLARKLKGLQTRRPEAQEKGRPEESGKKKGADNRNRGAQRKRGGSDWATTEPTLSCTQMTALD